MNIMMPLYAVLTAGFIYKLYVSKNIKYKAVLLAIQYGILTLVFVSLLVCFNVFKFENISSYIILFAVLLTVGYLCLKQEPLHQKL